MNRYERTQAWLDDHGITDQPLNEDDLPDDGIYYPPIPLESLELLGTVRAAGGPAMLFSLPIKTIVSLIDEVRSSRKLAQAPGCLATSDILDSEDGILITPLHEDDQEAIVAWLELVKREFL